MTVKYELKKIIGSRIFVAFFIALLCVNAIMAFYYAENPYSSERSSSAKVAQFFTDYEKDPEKYDRMFNEYTEMQEEYLKLIKIGQIFDIPAPESTELYPESGLNDGVFYNALYGRRNHNPEYKEKIAKILNESKKNLVIVTDSYTRDYLEQIISTYSGLYNIEHKSEFVFGWDQFVSYDTTNILMLPVVLIAAVMLMNADRDCGIENMIFSTKNGRRTVFAQKTLTVLTICFGAGILFDLVSFLGMLVKIDFYGWDSFLSATNSFVLCPYPIYIYEYILIKFCTKVIVVFALSLMAMLLSRVIKNIFALYGTLIFYIGVNYAFYAAQVFQKGSLIKHLNIFSLMDSNSVFAKYESVNIFGHSVPLLTASIITVLVLLIAGGCALFVVYMNFKSPTASNPLKKTILKIPAPYNLWFYEFKKIFLQTRIIWLILLIIAGKATYLYTVSNQEKTYNETAYMNYMYALEGDITAEKVAFLTEERERFANIFSNEAENAAKLSRGEISYKEFNKYHIVYLAAEKQALAFERVEEQYGYLANVSDNHVIEPKFVYDTGWKNLLLKNSDLLLMAILLAPAFAYFADYMNGFTSIIRTTKNGRKKTFWLKLIISIAFTVAVLLLFEFMDFLAVNKAFSLPLSSAPAVVLKLSNINSSLSLGELYGVLMLFKVFAAIAVTVSVVCLSQLINNPIAAVSTVAALIFLPYLLSLYFKDLFTIFSISTFFNIDILTNLNPLLATGVLTIVSGVILGYSYRKFVLS